MKPERGDAEVVTDALSLARDDVPFRVQRALHLIPPTGLGIARRMAFYAVVAWLPIAVWAWFVDRFLPGRSAEPFLHQFSIHARCLVAIPLFVLAEYTSAHLAHHIAERLLFEGFVAEADRPRLRTLLERCSRLRASALPWLVIGGVVLAYALASPTIEKNQEVLFTAPADGSPGHLTFGGLWYLYVVRPIFLGLLLAWVWRLVLWTVALAYVARLDLRLVPTHPDRMFGLVVLSRTPMAFWPLTLGVSTVVASVWAHDMLYAGTRIESYYGAAAVWAGGLAIVLLAPLVAFVPKFLRVRYAALFHYGSLLTQHGRLVHRKWIDGEDVGTPPVLDAPEIGPVADAAAMYDAVRAQLPIPVNLVTLLMVLLPIAVPLLAVAALQLPIGELLMKLLTSLV